MKTRIALLTGLCALVAAAPPAAPAKPAKRPPAHPSATGTGGAVASVDPYATKAGMAVLRRGGNAVDAAVAAASVLGVVEPYSSGIGGGGFMVIHWARKDWTTTIDGRETAPAAFPENAFHDPQTGQPYPSSKFRELATSGLAVGVPGTVRTWELALRRYGTMKLRQLMRPSIKLARRGFVVDPTFAQQTEANLDRFNDFSSTRETYTVDGQAPAPGSTHRNRDLARTLKAIAKRGSRALHRGPIAEDIVQAVKHPPLVEGSSRNARPGHMELADLRDYEAKWRKPAGVRYRGLEVVGMGPPSSGASTIGEALNIIEEGPAEESTVDRLHRYLEASKLAFADRGQYLGDPDFVDVPLAGLLSQDFACQRAKHIGPAPMDAPVAAGDPRNVDAACSPSDGTRSAAAGPEGPSTTHLTTSDRWGNVVSYTFTIEQTGGSGIVVPDRGFLLNNELTDFNFQTGTANSPAGGKRPRSSMSPTIVFEDGEPLLALGSPGGSTIITTVLQVLLNRIDLGMGLRRAIAAPRASQRNTPSVTAEAAFIESDVGKALAARGHTFSDGGEIGAVTAIEFLGGRRVLAAAEPARRGGGAAAAERRKGRQRGDGRGNDRRRDRRDR